MVFSLFELIFLSFSCYYIWPLRLHTIPYEIIYKE
jgi:hypothetical protein